MARRHTYEMLLVLTFVGAIQTSKAIVQPDDGGWINELIAVGLPVCVLTGWWAYYAWHIRSLGEFERDMAIRSLAISCAVTVWLFTVWGLAVSFASAPSIPLAMIAPAAALVYGLVRVILFLRYR